MLGAAAEGRAEHRDLVGGAKQVQHNTVQPIPAPPLPDERGLAWQAASSPGRAGETQAHLCRRDHGPHVPARAVCEIPAVAEERHRRRTGGGEGGDGKAGGD